MTDPLTQIIGLLRPSAAYSKLVTASGSWSVRPPGTGPFYAAVLEGGCELSVAGRIPVRIGHGDFILIPAYTVFTVTSLRPPPHGRLNEPVEIRPGVFHVGEPGEPELRMLVGYCAFESNDAALLVSLLPEVAVVRRNARLTILVELLTDEAHAGRPGREVVLARLLEVLLIEAFRAAAEPAAAPGLLRGLADERLATALRRMHAEPARSWTVGELAKEAAMSRSTFFDRFRQKVGIAPMRYLLGWRMAIAKDLLRDAGVSVDEAAQRVGYSSSSTFSVAFTRQVGSSPMAYARTGSAPNDI